METTIESNKTKRPDTSIDRNFKDPYVLCGYGCLAASLALFVIGEKMTLRSEQDAFGVFIAHYIISIGYVVALIVDGAYGIRKSWRRENIDKTIILLNIFLVSAYALNRVLPVFANSVSWLCVYLVTTSAVLLSFRYFDRLNSWINRIQQLVLGSVVVFYLYLAGYVTEVYGMGAAGTLFFGIGAHVFVPLTLVTACIFLIRYTIRKTNGSILWIVTGTTLTIGFVLIFMGEWNNRVAKIETIANQAPIYQTDGLPVWVNVAQHINNDWITEKVIKSDLVYTTYNWNQGWSFFPGRVTWEEERKHDPLVFISTLISECPLSIEDRVKVLQSIFSDRHNANERLWSGDNLTTSYIVTDVDVYPALRLAYTEKYLNVRNTIPGDSWSGDTQEAIYTFQLSEGAVVTSLSLWIAGKEEKGILTSKQKAADAYKTIVGTERRDPSVVHWQEGNTVTVRVFPCTPDEERKFKIGITSPLIEHDGEIIYKNVTFRGPSASDARETIRVRFIGDSKDIVLSDRFEKDENGDYFTEHLYDPHFNISFGAMPMRQNQFTFDGYTYSMHSLQPQFEAASIDQIFLDVNSSWSDDEIEAAGGFIPQYKVYAVRNNRIIQLTNENWGDVIAEVSRDNFSVFPFHLINRPQNSLVITKGKPLSPHLADFKDSKFSKDISRYFAGGERVKVYNLEGGSSTYVSALREFRSLEFSVGDMEQLTGWLAAKKFPRAQESEEKIILHDAQVVITKTKSATMAKNADNAPDHLARLFAYNNIMRKVGVHYFDDDFVCDDLVKEASTAYVVSPVSSLIVLETQNDYDRFGIKDHVNSLQNATKQSTGAVPEPHEWALIGLFFLFIVYMKFRQSKLVYKA